MPSEPQADNIYQRSRVDRLTTQVPLCDNMGLTTWKNAPDGRILRSDTYTAKNYLDEKQIRQLENAWPIYAEGTDCKEKEKSA